MVVSAFVITDDFTLDGFLRHLRGDPTNAVFFRRSGGDSQLQSIEHVAGVSAGGPDDVIQSLLFHLSPEVPKTTLFICEGAAGQGFQVFLSQGIQLKKAGAGEKGGVHFKRGILRGCPDQDDCSIFHEGEKGILLGLVETVDFVDKQQGAQVIHSQLFFCVPGDTADLGHPGDYSVQLFKTGLGRIGNHFGQSGFSRSRRAVKKYR